MGTHIHERLPMEYKICSEGINKVLQTAWNTILEEDTKVNKTATLTLIAELYKTRLEMASNAFVITESLNQIEYVKEQILGFYNSKQATSNVSTPIITPVR